MTTDFQVNVGGETITSTLEQAVHWGAMCPLCHHMTTFFELMTTNWDKRHYCTTTREKPMTTKAEEEKKALDSQAKLRKQSEAFKNEAKKAVKDHDAGVKKGQKT